MDNLFSKIKSSVAGNPLAGDFDIAESVVGTAGLDLVWKIYNAHQKNTKQAASVFVFEKKQIEKLNKSDKNDYLTSLKRGVTQLTRLRHPKILSVLHPLDENRECLAFATERISCSLANALGDQRNLNGGVIPQSLDDIEIKYGLLQLCDALSFLHNDARMVHSNIHPTSILLDEKRVWKLAGFDFAISNTSQISSDVFFECPEWRSDRVEGLQPNLDYLAPERVLHSRCDVKSDMYSVGVLLHAVYNQGKPVYQSHRNKSSCKQHIHEIRTLKHSHTRNIPETLKMHMKPLLAVESTERMDAKSFAKVGYFDDVCVATLLYLDSLVQRDNLQKSQYFKGLPNILKQLPLTLCVHRVLPVLFAECSNVDMIPFVLQNILTIAERCSKQQYFEHILPRLTPIMRITQPIQIPFMFMRYMSVLLEKTAHKETKDHILPMILLCIDVNNAQLQELCLNALPTFSHLIDQETMKKGVIPRIQKLCINTQQPSTRVKCLLCIGKMMDHMDKWFVLDSIIPFVSSMPNKDAATLMTVLGICKTAFTHKNLGVPREQLANKMIPTLVAFSVDHSLSKSQFQQYMAVIREMLTAFEKEQIAKLDEIKSKESQDPNLKFGEDITSDDQMMNFLREAGLSHTSAPSPKTQSHSTSSQSPAKVKDLTSSLSSISIAPPTGSPQITPNFASSLTLTSKTNIPTQPVKPLQATSTNSTAMSSSTGIDWTSSTSSGIDWTKTSSPANSDWSNPPKPSSDWTSSSNSSANWMQTSASDMNWMTSAANKPNSTTSAHGWQGNLTSSAGAWGTGAADGGVPRSTSQSNNRHSGWGTSMNSGGMMINNHNTNSMSVLQPMQTSMTRGSSQGQRQGQASKPLSSVDLQDLLG